MKTIKNTLLTLTLIFAGSSYANGSIKTGEFITITPGDEVSGTTQIIKDNNGSQFILLNDDFETKSAPALYVVLHKQVVPTSYTARNSVMVAKLAKVNGLQLYKLPANVNLEDYKAVIIWCKKFDVTFGSAELLDSEI